MSDARRRGSIFAGVLLVLIGVLFLIDIYYPGLRLGHLIAVYWPALLILWGVVKIGDYLLAQRRGGPRPAFVSGGEAALIVVLAIVLGGFVIRDWVRDRIPRFSIDLPEFGPSYSQNETLPVQTIPPDARLAIDVPRGDIAVQGHAGNELRVSAQKTAWGASQTSAERAIQGATVRIDNAGGLYHIGPQFGFDRRGRASMDLSVQVPAGASVAAGTMHGDIHIAGISGSAQAHSAGGDIDVQNAGSDVDVTLARGDARIAGVTGNVRVTGRGGDVNISDVKGQVSVEGSFAGTIHAQNVARTIRCALPWSQITIAQLTGTLEADLGDLSISGASGPVKIATHNSDVNVSKVTGRLDIADVHGDIKVALAAPPREDINITDLAGDIDLTLPAQSAFEVHAVSRGGSVESDFSGAQLNTSNTDASGQIMGWVGAAGGPRITIATTYGSIHLRKAE